MKIIITALLFGSLIAPGLKPSYTSSEIIAEYPKAFGTVIYDKYFTPYGPEDVDQLHFMGQFNFQFWGLVHYLETFYSGIDREDMKKYISDPKKLNAEYVKALQNSKEFNHYYMIILDKYLQSKGSKISDVKQAPIEEITEDQLMEIAAKFFTGLYIPEQKKILFRVCVGTSGAIPQYCKLNPIVEGFCYNTIRMFDSENDDDVNFYNDLDGYFPILQNLEMNGASDEERKELVRTELDYLVQRSERLKKLLLREYDLHKTILPFRIVN